MDRRTFLRSSASVASVSAIAGCSALGGSSDYTFEFAAEEAWDGFDFQSQGAGFVAGGRFSLEPGQWTAQGFTSANIIRLGYDFNIMSGNGVEFIIVSRDEFEEFENRNDAEIRFSDSLEGRGAANTTVEAREFRVILDNTEYGDMGTGGNTSSGTLQLEAQPR